MKKVYNTISYIFQPLLMPTYGMILLINLRIFDVLPVAWRAQAILGTFLLTGLMPALPILFMLKKGEVHDVFISKREERTIPYIFSFLAYLFWTIYMWLVLEFPLFMIGMGAGTILSIILIIFINLKWKISAHMSGIGSLAGGIFGVCYRLAYNPLWFLITVLFIAALVAISRIELKAHTPGQTLAGFSVGFACVFTPCLIF